MRLTKTEASEWLRSFGEASRWKWTNVEIKSRIKEILDLLAEEDDKLPKNLTGMKKKDLQRECTERNIQFGEYETRANMMRKIREQVEVEKGGTKESIMGFGKFPDLTYAEVAEKHPAYVMWARERVKEEGQGSNWRLRKFVTWLDKEGWRTPDVMKAETPIRFGTVALMEENPNPTNKVEEQILGALGKLDKRLNSIETRLHSLETMMAIFLRRDPRPA